MRRKSTIELEHNIEINLVERGRRKLWHYAMHNIVTDTGRQFILEAITPSNLSPGSFVRTQDQVVRYIGFGIGGSRQTDPLAAASPLADAHPGGYAGSNAQSDDDPTVQTLERPILTDGTNYLKEINTPGTFTTSTESTYVATFSRSDLNLGVHSIMPISEIGLYTSAADPTLPNGSAGAYPGAGGSLVAYDTFNSIPKSGVFSIEVRWTIRLG